VNIAILEKSIKIKLNSENQKEMADCAAHEHHQHDGRLQLSQHAAESHYGGDRCGSAF